MVGLLVILAITAVVAGNYIKWIINKNKEADEKNDTDLQCIKNAFMCLF